MSEHDRPNEAEWNPVCTQGAILPADGPSTIRGSIQGYRIAGIVVLLCTAYLISLITRYTPPDEAFFPVSATLWGLVLLLASFGTTALYLARQRARSLRRFGDVSLALETNPALLGGKLRAALRAEHGFPDEARGTFDLVCTIRSPTARNMGNSYTRTVWRDTVKSSGCDVIIPVEFTLPEQLPESGSDVRSDGERCKWILLATVKCAGARFAGCFDIPVFKRETVAHGSAANVGVSER